MKVNTLITNAHSPHQSQLEVESSSKYFIAIGVICVFLTDVDCYIGVSSFPQRWETLLSWEEITCIISRSTTDSRRDITTYQLIAHQHTVEPRLETLSLSVNADQSQKLLDSMSAESRSKELKVTLERLLSCSEWSGGAE